MIFKIKGEEKRYFAFVKGRPSQKYDIIKGGTVIYNKPDEININKAKKAVEELGIESRWHDVQFKVFEPSE